MKHLFSLLFISFFSQIASFSIAQSEVALQIELLTPDLIGEVIIDQDPLIEWVKLINEDIKTECAKEKGDKDLIVSITINCNADATIELFSLPAMKATIIKNLEKKIAAHPSPRTKFNDYSLLIGCKINEGAQTDGYFTPRLVLPNDRKMADFRALSLVDKQNHIQLWIKSDILPLLAYYETNVDSAYLGVLSVGNLLNNGDFLQESTDQLTDLDPNYWRAVMEMSHGNQLIPFTKACIYLANGEFDKAKRLLYVLRFFYDKSTLPAKLDDEISDKLNLFMSELGAEIQIGIELHDLKKYDKAIAHYDALLKDFSNSAWLNYEMYFSKSAASEDMDIDNSDWKSAQKIIYSCDPMYPINARANSGKEGFLLYRRQEINSLFVDDEKLRTDFVKYADIALDLENYGFAAQLYWLGLSHLNEEDYESRDLLAYFLYCLKKLGDTETLNNFKEDYTTKYEEIEAERLEIMRNSTFYKAFEKEE